MALSMRMRQQGRKNKRMFRFVVADSRSPRDGKYIDCVGHYDPHIEDGMTVDKEKIETWLRKRGAADNKNALCFEKKMP